MQDGFLFPDTIAFNIAPGAEEIDTERLIKSAEIANIKGFIESLPLSYNTKIGSSGHGLSEGQKQRLLIARALIHQPQLLILDEPCPGLDLVAREKLLQGLEALSQTANAPTIIFVTHHLEEIMPSWAHVLLLKQGKCLAQGHKQEILSSELLSEAFEIPIQVATDGKRYRAFACFS